MQETSAWTAPTGVLGRLVGLANERVSQGRAALEELRARGRDSSPVPRFSDAIRGNGDVGVIAELKRSSPSKGTLNPTLSATSRAVQYEAGGAVALSVLTEPSEFGGSLTDLADVRSVVSVPLLRKDFHVDESQIWEARIAGASAFLLIARAVEPSLLEFLSGSTVDAGLEPLIEVRSRRELELAIRLEAPLIGVNARDLETLVMDGAIHAELLPSVPHDRVAIAESGVARVADVERAARCGADAVLVGSVLSVAVDGTAAVRELTGVKRAARAT